MGFKGANHGRDTAGISHQRRPKTTHLGNPIQVGKNYKVDRKLVLKYNDFIREHQHLLVWPYDVVMLGGERDET